MNARISPERAERIRSLFSQLIEAKGRSRVERLEEIHGSDPELGEELESLLVAAERLTGSSLNLDWLLGSVRRSYETDESLEGTTASHFRIIEPLGKGGMGIVYRAEDVRLNRMVALKFLPAHMRPDETARERFMQEARAASRLDHPNVCTVYEVDRTHDGRTFIAMPCYEGETIASMQLGEEMSIGRAVDYASQVLSGLEAAHRQGIVHRDIKPANLFVTTEGTVKILDFGVAKLATTELTRTGSVMGTTAYMSPEQVRGEEVDARTDIWSIGAVLYEMLSGRRPFGGAYELAVMYEILHRDPEPLPERVPEHVRGVVMRCLAKGRDDRFASAEEAVHALRQEEHAGRGVGRSRHGTWMAAAAVAVLVAALAVGLGVPRDGTSILHPLQSALGVFDDAPASRPLVVLPFSSYGGDANAAAFSMGMFEVLASKLGQMGTKNDSVWVVPAVDARAIAGLDAAREEFGNALVLSGSLRWSDDGVSLTLNLVDAATRRQIDVETMEAPDSGAARLQDEAANAAARMVGLDAARADRVASRGRSAVPGAGEYYVTARGHLLDYDRVESLDAAIELLRRATHADPDFAAAHAALAHAFWRKFEISGDDQFARTAETYADTASSRGDELPEVLVAVGMVQRGVGRYEEAIRSLTRALDLDERSIDAHRELAIAYEQLAELDGGEDHLRRAEEHLVRANALQPQYWRTYRDLGVFYIQHGRLGEAVEAFEHATSLAPGNGRLYGQLGSLYMMAFRLDDARKAFQQAMKHDPDARAYVNLGTAYMLEQNYDRAIDLFERATDLMPDHYRTWGSLAEAYYWSRSHPGKANDAFVRAVERLEAELSVNPRDADQLGQLAVFFAYQGRSDRARETISRALALAPEDADVLARAAEVFALTGDDRQADAYVDRAAEEGYPRFYVERSPLLAAYLDDDKIALPEVF